MYRTFYQTRTIEKTEERKRLLSNNIIETWRQWGPYLSERQWGTVREWYNSNTDPWNDFQHDQARSRAYRWGEDGIAGISDIHQFLCFSVAMWNGTDPILKERLFGLTNGEGNHGEDVKEYYYYLDNTPTHSYMKYLYKYPYHYPYADIVNNSRAIDPLEYELINTGALDQNRYFDIMVEYAKNDPEDILIRITATNRGNEFKTLHLLPTLLFRNTWSWGDSTTIKPGLSFQEADGTQVIEASAVTVKDSQTGKTIELQKKMYLYCKDADSFLFTENETNFERFGWGSNASPYVKDGINNFIIHGQHSAINQSQGTKASAAHRLGLAPGQSSTICLRLSAKKLRTPFGSGFDTAFQTRQHEADEFYDAICPFSRTANSTEQDKYWVQRQAFAGMLWGVQLYHVIVNRWLAGDTHPASFEHQNNDQMNRWHHLYCKDILSMPDKWEYPWFAAWDLAFHTTTLAIIDPDFAKHQLELLVMEWYQHPNGQIPAYEWDFCNINPPVHAWAAWQVYQCEKEIYGRADMLFLERVFNKLNMNFTWWVNKVDRQGNNIFEGGFLGLDNIRIIDRDPQGNPIEQSDGTAWMAMFCLNMLKMATELTSLKNRQDRKAAYQYKDSARKYLQHFVYICDAMNRIGPEGLWDEQKGFFFDCANHFGRLEVYSMVGLVPLFAIEQISQKVTDPDSFYDLYGFIKWFARNRKDLVKSNMYINLDEFIEQVTSPKVPDSIHGTISVVDKQKLGSILSRMLDSDEFLSSAGIRSLSKYHLSNTHVELRNGYQYTVRYEPAESIQMKRMGGNSNWCGPVWMPVNYMLINSLRKFHKYLPEYKIQFPSGSDHWLDLNSVADELSERLIKIFLRDPHTGKRPVFGSVDLFQNDPHWKDYLLFYEYFHGGDSFDCHAGTGLGASHQTGWTGLVANLIQETGVKQKSQELGIDEDPDDLEFQANPAPDLVSV